MPEILPARTPQSMAKAVALLRRGEVIALPTDTLYGVGALVFNAAAAAKIYRVKNRPANKALPVFIQSLAELERVCQNIPSEALLILKRYWPGGLTAILPASPDLPGIVTNFGSTVAVRIPDHPVVLELLARLNEPLAVTSANISGRPTPQTASGVKSQFAGRLPLILDDGPSPASLPSTILDLTRFPPTVLRQGAVVVSG